MREKIIKCVRLAFSHDMQTAVDALEKLFKEIGEV